MSELPIDKISEKDLDEFLKASKEIDYDIALMVRHTRIVRQMAESINERIKGLINNSKLFEMFPQEFKDNFINILRSTDEIKSQLPGSEDSK